MLSGNWTVCTANCAVLWHCTAYCCHSSTFRLQQRHAHRWTLATHWQLHRHKWGWYRTETNCRFAIQHPVPCSDRSSSSVVHTGTDSLLQRAQFTVWYSTLGRALMHRIRTDRRNNQKQQREKWICTENSTKGPSFHRTAILNAVSWSNFCQIVIVMATVTLLRVTNMYSFQASVQVGEYTNHRESGTTHCK